MMQTWCISPSMGWARLSQAFRVGVELTAADPEAARVVTQRSIEIPSGNLLHSY